LQEKKGNLKQLCFFSVNSSNFTGFLEENCQILDITKLGGKKIKNPRTGSQRFCEGEFSPFCEEYSFKGLFCCKFRAFSNNGLEND
jgi:hypothetical protein